MDLSSAQIAIIGLGDLGLPLVAEFGRKRPVAGFDINIARVSELQSGREGVLELEPQELATLSQLEFSGMAAGLKPCQVLILTGPTLMHQANRRDLTPCMKPAQL